MGKAAGKNDPCRHRLCHFQVRNLRNFRADDPCITRSEKHPGKKEKFCQSWTEEVRTKKKTLGEAYTVAAIRERIGKEWKRYPYPKLPKIKVCRSNGRWNRAYRMGGYQASHIRDIYEIQNRYARIQMQDP